jgi:3-oxoacyl-[acyl-carrier protein] reductase
MKSVDNKVILVTGASRGIGTKIAESVAREGAKVIVNFSSSQQAAEAVLAKIKSIGGEAIAIKADVSKPDQVAAMFDEAIAHFGRIDVLINNAGAVLYKLLKDTTDEEFTNLLEINIRGTFNTLREAATKLEDGGTIINFSSSTTRMMLPTYGTYVATKGAVEQLTRVFAKEIGTRGINVNAVLPGPTNTELFTKGKSAEVIARMASLNAFNRIGEPEDIAKVVVFLASDDAKWINGQIIGLNGGMA